jgi:hypothetical protein
VEGYGGYNIVERGRHSLKKISSEKDKSADQKTSHTTI